MYNNLEKSGKDSNIKIEYYHLGNNSLYTCRQCGSDAKSLEVHVTQSFPYDHKCLKCPDCGYLLGYSSSGCVHSVFQEEWHRRKLDRLRQHSHLLSEWENGFLKTVPSYRNLSDKQVDKLNQIVEKVARARF